MNCDHLHGAFGPGCPHCMTRPAEELQRAWVMAPRYGEQAAFEAYYAARFPRPMNGATGRAPQVTNRAGASRRVSTQKESS